MEPAMDPTASKENCRQFWEGNSELPWGPGGTDTDSTHLTMGKLTNKHEERKERGKEKEKLYKVYVTSTKPYPHSVIPVSAPPWDTPSLVLWLGSAFQIRAGNIGAKFQVLLNFQRKYSQSITDSLSQFMLDQGILRPFKVKNHQDKVVKVHSENVTILHIHICIGSLTEFSQVLQYAPAGCSRGWDWGFCLSIIFSAGLSVIVVQSEDPSTVGRRALGASAAGFPGQPDRFCLQGAVEDTEKGAVLHPLVHTV